MIADRRSQHLLGIVLTDHEAVQVSLDIPWKMIELQVKRSFSSLRSIVRCAGLIGLRVEHSKPNLVAVLFAKELLHVSSELIRIRPCRIRVFDHLYKPPQDFL